MSSADGSDKTPGATRRCLLLADPGIRGAALPGDENLSSSESASGGPGEAWATGDSGSEQAGAPPGWSEPNPRISVASVPIPGA